MVKLPDVGRFRLTKVCCFQFLFRGGIYEDQYAQLLLYVRVRTSLIFRAEIEYKFRNHVFFFFLAAYVYLEGRGQFRQGRHHEEGCYEKGLGVGMRPPSHCPFLFRECAVPLDKKVLLFSLLLYFSV